jgi:hypothetical protein
MKPEAFFFGGHGFRGLVHVALGDVGLSTQAVFLPVQPVPEEVGFDSQPVPEDVGFDLQGALTVQPVPAAVGLSLQGGAHVFEGVFSLPANSAPGEASALINP